MVPNVLVAVCDACSTVVGIPQQSVPRIYEVTRTLRHSVEARIPRHLSDALVLALFELNAGSNAIGVLFRYYIDKLAHDKEQQALLRNLASSSEASGKATARFSAKLSTEFYHTFETLKVDSGLRTAALVKGVIVKIKLDVLDKKRPEVCEELRGLLRLAA
jgi:hypothetical protein